MSDDLKVVLDNCWVDGTSPDTLTVQRFCRWCHYSRPGEHDPECPCVALSLALQQRDALAGYAKAEKRNVVMQGAVRLANKSAKAEMKQRLNETVLLLEAAIARLRDLGIEEMVR
jgi:hypothetical protein